VLSFLLKPTVAFALAPPPTEFEIAINVFRAVKIFSYISENKKGYGIIQRRKYY